jgi:amino acid transporter
MIVSTAPPAKPIAFGTGATGVSAFRHSHAPLGELAQVYVGTPLAAVLDLGAVLSALGAGLGGVTVAARMMFAFGRDGLASRRLGGVSAVTGVPRRALAVEMSIGLVLLTAFRLAGTSALNVFFYLATIGVLSLLVMYILTNVAAKRCLGRSRGRSWRRPRASSSRGSFCTPTSGRCHPRRMSSSPGWCWHGLPSGWSSPR